MITLHHIYKRFPLHAGLFARYGQYVYAVNGVDMTIDREESYGLVGESGSGKTTIAKMIAGIHTVDHGALTIDAKPYRDAFTRPQSVQYIFQDPAKSLNPRQTVYTILTDGYRYHAPQSSKPQLVATATRQLERVGLNAADLYRRPTEFSGGQRQRIAIARALMYNPCILICDEIVSALDVSIKAQIINLLLELRTQLRMTLLFIAHDLSLVSYFCDRVGVLYRGVLVEEAASERLLQRRYHPYTERLFRSIPHIEDGAPRGTAPTASKVEPLAGTGAPAATSVKQPLDQADRGDQVAPIAAGGPHNPTIAPPSWTRGMIPYRMREVVAGHRVVDESF